MHILKLIRLVRMKMALTLKVKSCCKHVVPSVNVQHGLGIESIEGKADVKGLSE